IFLKIPQKLSKKEFPNNETYFRRELKRKVLHALASGYFIAFLFAYLLQLLVFSVYPSLFLKTDEYYISTYNLAFKIDPMISALSFLIFIFLGSFIIQINSELIRLNWPNANFPLKKTIATIKRESELRCFASHMHMIPSFCLGAILLIYFSHDYYITVYAIFGMIFISIFGDMSAALIGKKYGRHKWSFLEEKSIEGTLIGFIVSFSVGFLFLGFLGALIGSLIFIFTDIICPKITTISDNLLNPILISIAFVFLIQIPNVLHPILEIQLIGIGLISKPPLKYDIATGFWGTFLSVVLVIAIIILIGLCLALKYKKEEIKFLFTGKR
ncbi:MAG: hypothetical protein ACTSQJ_11215, partial [Promethearchaeota archaeon]